MCVLPGDKYFPLPDTLYASREHSLPEVTRTTAFLTTSPRTALIHVTCALNHRKPLIFAERTHLLRAGNAYDLYMDKRAPGPRPQRIASQSTNQPTNQRSNQVTLGTRRSPSYALFFFFSFSGIRQILKYNWNCNYIEARRNKMKY